LLQIQVAETMPYLTPRFSTLPSPPHNALLQIPSQSCKEKGPERK
jgi:hypothetical protein